MASSINPFPHKESRWRFSPSIIIFVVAIANFASFVIVASLIGGDALNGHMADGHYYLKSRGVATEVTPAVYRYSRWHAISVFVTHALAMGAALRMHYLKKRDG